MNGSFMLHGGEPATVLPVRGLAPAFQQRFIRLIKRLPEVQDAHH